MQVFIDGRDIRQLQLNWYRQQVRTRHSLSTPHWVQKNHQAIRHIFNCMEQHALQCQ